MARSATRRPSTPRTDVYELVTGRIVALLEAGTVPWHQPWDAAAGVPRSLSTGRPYRGVNTLLLGATALARGYSSPWWGTYHQITARGGQVRRGERHPAVVVVWKVLEPRGDDRAEAGERSDDGDTGRRRFLLRSFPVFNADQADGLGLTAPPARDLEPIGACEALVAGYLAAGPSLRHGGAIASYSPATDTVTVPARPAFESADAYYSTLFHELAHSTGHPVRLGREGIVEGRCFGDPVYAREELVAEMAAAMLAGLTGIDQTTVDASAAYLDNWTRVLRGDSRLVVQAAAAAQKAADLVAGDAADAVGTVGTDDGAEA